MKRILLLLLIFLKVSAGVIDELENAILESDLSAAEQLLAKGVSLSTIEQTALINLSTSVLQKREALMTVCEMKGWVSCPEVTKVLGGMFKERDEYRKKGLILFLAPICYLLGVGAIDFAAIFTRGTLDGFFGTYTAACWFICLYNLYKFDTKDRELKIVCQKRCEELWIAAIKIRQLLYKIAPTNSLLELQKQ